jgi:hypothetical protein
MAAEIKGDAMNEIDNPLYFLFQLACVIASAILGGIILLIVLGASRLYLFVTGPQSLKPEHGWLVGYKRLVWNDELQVWESPQGWNHSQWWQNQIVADQEPTQDNTHGIYVCKNRNDFLLRFEYPGTLFVVRMEEPIVEHERGYRAYKAYIAREA